MSEGSDPSFSSPLEAEVEAEVEVKLVELDPRGDITLSVEGENGKLVSKLRCCSRVLELASPVFTKMLNPRFRDGARLEQGDSPMITIQEEFPRAMVSLLSIVHHCQVDYEVLNLDGSPNTLYLRDMAVQADKYDCTLAVRGWMTWALTQCLPFVEQPTAFSHVVFSGYTCGTPNLEQIMRHAIGNVSKSSRCAWEMSNIVNRLPKPFVGESSSQIKPCVHYRLIFSQRICSAELKKS